MIEIASLFFNAFKLLSKKGKLFFTLNTTSLLFAAVMDGVVLTLVSSLIRDSQIGLAEQYERSINAPELIVLFLVFVGKGLSVIVSNYFTLKSFGVEEGEIAFKLFARFSQMQWKSIDAKSVGEEVSTIIHSPSALIRGLLMKVPTAVIEITNVLLILGLLLYLDFLTAIIALVYFSIFVTAQHFITSKKARKNGVKRGTLLDQVSDRLIEANRMNRLLRVMPSKSLDMLLKIKLIELGKTQSNSEFYSLIPRLLLEVVFGFGLLIIGSIIWAVNGIEEAIIGLSLFAVAGFRLLPLLSHIQALTIQILGDLPLARRILNSSLLNASNEDYISNNEIQFRELETNIHVEVSDLSYRYSSNLANSIDGISLKIEFGKINAIVGRSGAGKSTLVDLLLGLMQPDEGVIFWNSNFSRILGYVPQEVELASMSINHNISLEWMEEMPELSEYANRHLEFLRANGFELPESANAVQLSGGQRQIIGMIRALNLNPTFLVLDEASSAMDNETEDCVAKILSEIRGKCTVVLIAHRLSTVKNADVIHYISDGKIVSSGTFDYIRSKVPDFEKQIQLGLI